MGHAVAQLFEAPRYKPEGRGFDSRWCHLNWHNPSGRTMALGSTQPLTEMSTRNIFLGVKEAGAFGWQTYHYLMPIVMKSGSLNLLEPSEPVQACNGISLPFLLGTKTPNYENNDNLVGEFHKLAQKLLYWSSRFPKYVDGFPHKVSTRNASCRRTVLANSSTQGRISKITRNNWNTGGVQKRRAELKQNKRKLTAIQQDEVLCRSGCETL